MTYKNDSSIDQSGIITNCNLILNILRIISMIEKKIEQIARRNYNSRSQYPKVFFQIQSMLHVLRTWIKKYGQFCNLPVFAVLLGDYLSRISVLTGELIKICEPVNGKKSVKKTRLEKEQEGFKKSVNKMLANIFEALLGFKTNDTEIEFHFENALIKAFENHCLQEYKKEIQKHISSRGDKTCIFPCSDREDYLAIVEDKKRFQAEVVEKLKNYKHASGHMPGCKCSGKYWLKGFRASKRKPVLQGGQQHEFPIRMVQCADCGQRFSLLPSFLPREKHFGIDIIGNIVRGVVLFGQSLHAALNIFKLTGAEIKSRQTILNWLRWFGTLHPAAVLIRAGIKGSGYLQEDEGFEKESGMRTYTAAMVDPENLLVWHLDYVDHVDEETLTESFEKFIESIDFKIIGVTKDKWQPASDALKNVCHGLWIGFCHLHCLKKFRKALSEYQKESGCSLKKVRELYKKFRKILDTAASNANLKSKIGFLNDEAFNYPPVRTILEQVIRDGAHYTCNKRKKGIKKTTSIADNFLKIVKRKLRQAESFRDKECTGLLFRAMANIRNFVPFLSGAENAHKSPFMMAQGETFDLPWVQIMNVHNAFLFTENAL